MKAIDEKRKQKLEKEISDLWNDKDQKEGRIIAYGDSEIDWINDYLYERDLFMEITDSESIGNDEFWLTLTKL